MVEVEDEAQGQTGQLPTEVEDKDQAQTGQLPTRVEGEEGEAPVEDAREPFTDKNLLPTEEGALPTNFIFP